MNYYFNKVLESAKQNTCYARLADYETKIMQAAGKLKLYVQYKGTPSEDIYKNSFIDECLGSSCDDAVQNLVSALDGNSGMFGCDLMQILYQGDVNGNYYLGWNDQVTSKAAYILVLIISGIATQSAYQTLKTGNKLAWTVVQSHYTEPVIRIVDRIKQYSDQCMNEMWNTARVNTERILIEHKGAPNTDMTEVI